MNDTTQQVDLVVLGATGFTGRLLVARLAVLERRAADAGEPFPTWAVAGRDRGRLEAVLQSLPEPSGSPPVIDEIDVHDVASLELLASRTRVLLNAVGPYSSSAETVVEACVRAGTHYADLSGELPLLRRVIDRFHERAAGAGCQVVQLAGWEALPPDVAALHACRVAAGSEPGTWGPGAAAPVRQVDVAVSFEATPGVSGAVSAGTLGSIVEIFSDPGAGIVGDPAGLLPAGQPVDAGAVRRNSPLHVRPFVHAGRLLGPLVPVAFLNPPALHRTAALLALQSATTRAPARIREGVDHGAVRHARTLRGVPGQVLQSVVQRSIAVVTRLPLWSRNQLAALVRRRLPASGTGPSPAALDGWRWTIRAEAVAAGGGRGTATIAGTGHPGYTATAAMLVALGLHLAEPGYEPLMPGAVTPAVAFGPDISRHLSTPELRLTVG